MTINNYNLNYISDKNIIAEKFEAISIVGRGRSSVVYKAKYLNTTDNKKKEQFVALKILPLTEKKSEAFLARIKRESLAMLSSKHTNVIRLYDFIADSENCILVMEYANSGDLKHLLDEKKQALKLDLALDFIVQTLKGLEHLHKLGIIHRDIKPDNLLLQDKHVIKIADFSVADIPLRELRKTSNELNNAVGTIDYIAPEVLSSEQSSESSDIFSVGVTFYQLITNKLPFEAESFSEHMDSKISGKFKPASEINKNIPRAIDKIISKAMATNSKERFKSAREFINAIEIYRNSLDILDEDYSLKKEAVNSSFSAGNLILEEDESIVKAENIPLRTISSKKHIFKMIAGSAVCFLAIATAASFYLEYNLRNSQAKEATKGNAFNLSQDNIEEEFEPKRTGEAKVGNELEVANINTPAAFVSLATNNYFGTFKKLFADGSDVKFSCGPNSDSSKIILQVPLAGWDNVEIDLAEFVKNRTVLLDHAGIKLELNFENAILKEGNVIVAEYKDLLSGKSGEVIFK